MIYCGFGQPAEFTDSSRISWPIEGDEKIEAAIAAAQLKMRPVIKRRLIWAAAIVVSLLIIVLAVIVLVDASALSITETAKRCAPSIWQSQWPIYLGCAVAAHEGLAGGLFGAAGALFAAWLAFTAVMEQIAAEKQLRDQQLSSEQERTRRQQASAREVANVCVTPAIRAAAVAMLAIDRAAVNPVGLWDQVEKALKHLQAMLDLFAIRESARELAAEDRIRYLELIGMLATLISVSQYGSSTLQERRNVLWSGFAKFYDLLKRYDLELAREFAAVSEVVRSPVA